MSEIKMLNLFRCSSGENRMLEKDIHYFVTDYFDGIKIEDLNSDSVTLAECMGIKKAANRNNVGISHQRYCLYSEEDSEEDILGTNQELPLLTVIQVFINPDIYQATGFAEDGKEISCGNCMYRVRKHIQKQFKSNGKIRWKMYRLLTAGDFAIIVRSERIHDAYDISTLIRKICMVPEETGKREAVFFTYSISGVLDRCVDGQEVYTSLDWRKCLNADDRVMVRIVYNHANELKNVTVENYVSIQEEFLKSGYRLLGRYDYQMECTPSEFQELYSYIRNYKLGMDGLETEILNGDFSSKVKALLLMMQNGYVLRINEKIYLYYESDKLLSEASTCIWKVNVEKTWTSLYEYNEDVILQIKDSVVQIEDKLMYLYQSERNLKESVRLLGRFCRVLHEINQMLELRVSTANLAKQLKIMVESLQYYLDNAEKNDCDNRKIANRVSEYLRLGINDLEIFARYVGNINLQTLQTPNYDLQTNMCIEKILLAYSQFLRPFLMGQDAGGDEKKPYHFSGALYPMVVPNMAVRDLSVCVLFDDYHFEDDIQERKIYEKLVIVNNPTFLYLCENCFFIPTVFHEIAHQFRYETHRKRNGCLEKYLMKSFLYDIVIEIIDEEGEYGFDLEEGIENVIDEVYKRIEGKLVVDKTKEMGLQFFALEFESAMQEFFEMVNEQIMPTAFIKQYIERTKGDVIKYDVEILNLMKEIRDEAEKLENTFTENEDCDYDIFNQLLKNLENYFVMQEAQLFGEIIRRINIIAEEMRQSHGENQVVKVLGEFCMESWKGKNPDEKGRRIFLIWNDLEKNEYISDYIVREDLKGLLKSYHNLCNAYRELEGKCDLEKMIRGFHYQNVFGDLCMALYESLLEMLEEFENDRNRQLEWDAICMEGEWFGQLKRRIKFEKEEGIKKRLRNIFLKYQGEKIGEFINSYIDCYREVTSDLFMCSMMGLNGFGYLVIVAENFAFNEENEFALYKRISFVLQCLSKKRNKTELNADDFSRDLLEILCHELNVLQSQCDAIGLRVEKWDASEVELGEIVRFLQKQRDSKGMTSTQDWILRIYLKISYIIFNIKDVQVACEEIGGKEMWCDIISEDSYIERKEDLKKVVDQNDGMELCNGIAEILNSPASYFNSKKYLLNEEIRFIFRHYEKNCKQIFI